jgi:ARG and Rhodanese-Phosphatase-superfamily-associated Protein domain
MLDIRLGPPRRHETLSIIPLVTSGAAELPYLLLADALAAGTLRITEVGSGMVPRLLADNTGDLDVLVLDGEQLIGAKQNRMTNRTILLPAHRQTEIPVSCMEQGRWRFDSRHFAPSAQHSPAKVRRKARDLEAAYVADGLAPAETMLAGAQGAVWAEIMEVSSRARSESRSYALDAAFVASSNEIDAWVKMFPPVEGQVGLVGIVPGCHREPTRTTPGAWLWTTVIGMDVIGTPALYARLHERLLRGYIMDALDAMRDRPLYGLGSGREWEEGAIGNEEAIRDRKAAAASDSDEHLSACAQRFLDSTREAVRTTAPSVGRGRYEVLSGTIVGGSLTDDALEPERVVHTSAFPLESADAERPPHSSAVEPGPIARPSRRRRPE